MIKITKINQNLIEVQEIIHFWKKDVVLYWYYDILYWKVSTFGKKNDIPNRELSLEMIQWIKNNYLSKI